MEFIQKSRFHGSPYTNEINIHNKAHCCFPGIVFSATSWCFHTFQTPSHPANHKKNTVRSRKERRGAYVITTAPKTTRSARAGRAAGRTWNSTIKDLASSKCSLITLKLLSFLEPLSNLQGEIHQTHCLFPHVTETDLGPQREGTGLFEGVPLTIPPDRTQVVRLPILNSVWLHHKPNFM